MTPAKRMEAFLEKSGPAHKNIDCYGSQIVVTCASNSAAEKWAHLFGSTKGAIKVSCIVETYDQTKATEGQPPGNREYTKVWRTFAEVA